MSRIWFAGELETVATWWRVYRRDGVTLGFTSHDRDLIFDDVRHRAAPGMVPSAIRLTADFDPDSAEVTGALDHSAITAPDLAAGRYDEALIELGVVDWQTLETSLIYAGTIGGVENDAGQFTAELFSLKSVLTEDRIPRTSPTCRADFCGPGCNLSPERFVHEVQIASIDHEDNVIVLQSGPTADLLLEGSLTFIDGDIAGFRHRIVAHDADRLILDPLLPDAAMAGVRVLVREGCDHLVATCAGRFGNSANFRGEPFLPGNDLLSRYPTAK